MATTISSSSATCRGRGECKHRGFPHMARRSRPVTPGERAGFLGGGHSGGQNSSGMRWKHPMVFQAARGPPWEPHSDL